MEDAVRALEEGQMTVREAAETFGVPKSTLHDRLKKPDELKSTRGRPTVLTQVEELGIVRACISLSSIGFGLSRDHVGKLVSRYQDRPNPFKNGIPGRYWWLGFLQRWNHKLSERKPQHLSKRRAEAANEEVITGFYDFIRSTLQRHGLFDLPHYEIAPRLWNCDESGMRTGGCYSKARILAQKGARTVSETGNSSGKEQISVLVCGSAIGQVMPPYVLYKSEQLDVSWMSGGPEGTLYASSSSGWKPIISILGLSMDF
eukprot:m.271081 g.271081  ORF g.271081 m.271081 type:complete len:259 (+) comp40549_c0_seq5:2584-3360(+)